MTTTPSPKDRDSHRSGPVPDHPVARGRAGALRGRAVSARRAERTAAARRCARLRAGGRRRGADRRAAVRSLQCRWLCGALRRSRVAPAKRRRCGMLLNDEVIACGTAPTRPVLSGTATSIATGGPVPRGADAIVMVEHTAAGGHSRDRNPPRRLARAVRLLCRLRHRARRGAAARRHHRSARARSACWRPAALREVAVARRPRVAMLSTGDELVQPGQPLRPAAIYDTNGAIVTAAISGEWRRGGVSRRHSRR